MIERIGVVVPAANEQDELPGCLAALHHARDRAEEVGVRVRVVVVLDGCTDGSAEVVSAAPRVESISVSGRCVGRARAAGAAHLMRDCVDPPRMLLASTDADSLVPAGWLTGMLTTVRAGAHLVLGAVVPRPGLPPATVARWAARHPAGGNHPHVHAANLGIRCDAYVALGGWRALSCGEDQDLARRAGDLGWIRIVRSAGQPVATSARLDGRAPAGFAGYLRALLAEPDELVS